MIRAAANPLRELRAARSLSQQAAADAVGVSRPLWSSWECGIRELRVPHIAAIQRRWDLSDREILRIFRWVASAS